MALQQVDATSGDSVAKLDAYALMDAFTEMLDPSGTPRAPPTA